MSQELDRLLSLTMLMFTHDWRWAGCVSGLYDGVEGWTVSSLQLTFRISVSLKTP